MNGFWATTKEERKSSKARAALCGMIEPIPQSIIFIKHYDSSPLTPAMIEDHDENKSKQQGKCLSEMRDRQRAAEGTSSWTASRIYTTPPTGPKLQATEWYGSKDGRSCRLSRRIRRVMAFKRECDWWRAEFVCCLTGSWYSLLWSRPYPKVPRFAHRTFGQSTGTDG
jgi:hypothetical protein